MYGKLDLAKNFTLRQRLIELKQGNNPITTYFNRLSTVWNELDMAKEMLERPMETISRYQKIRDWDRLSNFLLGLNKSFLAFRTQILASSPPPTLCRTFQLAVQDESQRQITSEGNRLADGMAFVALREVVSEKKCVSWNVEWATRATNEKREFLYEGGDGSDDPKLAAYLNTSNGSQAATSQARLNGSTSLSKGSKG